MDVFYVHIADPGFPEPPLPGARRLGPFLTLEEAEAQVVSDLANGLMEWPDAEAEHLGIFSDEHSTILTMKPDDPLAVDLLDREKLQPQVDAILEERAAEQRRVISEAANRAAGLPDSGGSLVDALVANGILKFSDEQLAALRAAGVLS